MEERMRGLEVRVERLHGTMSDLKDQLTRESRERREDRWTVLYAGFNAWMIMLMLLVNGCSSLSERQERLDSKVSDLRAAVDRAAR